MSDAVLSGGLTLDAPVGMLQVRKKEIEYICISRCIKTGRQIGGWIDEWMDGYILTRLTLDAPVGLLQV